MNNLQLNLTSNLEKFVREAIKNENITSYKIIRKSSPQKGEGYIGQVDFVQVKGLIKNPVTTHKETNNGYEKHEEEESKILELVVKAAPTNKNLRQEIPIRKLFLVENFHYSKIHPKFYQLQKDYNVQDPFNSIAKCYATFDEDGQEALVMENYKAKGYKLWNRKVPMDADHVILVMKEYGKLHSLSFALRDLRKEEFLELCSGLKNRNFYDFFAMSQNEMIYLWNRIKDSFDEPEEDVVKKMEAFKDSIIPFFYDVTTQVDECSVISHGDSWTNNLLFKYKDSNNDGNSQKPAALCILDWQVSRPSSPVLDLSFYLYISTSIKILDDLHKFLQIYHDSFCCHLRKFGCDPNRLFPFDKFMEHWKMYSKYGLFMAVVLIKLNLTEQEDTLDYVKIAEAGGRLVDAFEARPSCEEERLERSREIVRHFVKRNLL